jgi:hypothetical protein
MSAPTITVSGVIFTFNEGDCESVESSLASNLDYDSMPMSTPDGALLFDVNGVTKTITMRGNLSNSGSTRLSVGTATTLNDQRKWLEQNLNGSQAGGTISSNYTDTWNGTGWYASTIMFSTIRFTENEGNPMGLQFEITLLVGSV